MVSTADQYTFCPFANKMNWTKLSWYLTYFFLSLQRFTQYTKEGKLFSLPAFYKIYGFILNYEQGYLAKLPRSGGSFSHPSQFLISFHFLALPTDLFSPSPQPFPSLLICIHDGCCCISLSLSSLLSLGKVGTPPVVGLSLKTPLPKCACVRALLGNKPRRGIFDYGSSSLLFCLAGWSDLSA